MPPFPRIRSISRSARYQIGDGGNPNRNASQDVMDGLNQYRFMNDAELLAAWESASNVAGPHASSKPATDDTPAPGNQPAAGGEVRPAA